MAEDRQATDIRLDSVTALSAHDLTINLGSLERASGRLHGARAGANIYLSPSSTTIAFTLFTPTKQRFTHDHHLYYWATVTRFDRSQALQLKHG
jgi:hypothetical protein